MRSRARALQRLQTVAIRRRIHADCHRAVAGLGDRRRHEGQLNGVQRPPASREALGAAWLTSLRLGIAESTRCSFSSEVREVVQGRPYEAEAKSVKGRMAARPPGGEVPVRQLIPDRYVARL
jgi:hypothetical protein